MQGLLVTFLVLCQNITTKAIYKRQCFNWAYSFKVHNVEPRPGSKSSWKLTSDPQPGGREHTGDVVSPLRPHSPSVVTCLFQQGHTSKTFLHSSMYGDQVLKHEPLRGIFTQTSTRGTGYPIPEPHQRLTFIIQPVSTPPTSETVTNPIFGWFSFPSIFLLLLVPLWRSCGS